MKNILLIEDDTSLAEGLMIILQDEGYMVETVSDNTGLQQKLVHYKPDLLIVDYRLPGEDGGTITRRLKTRAETKHIPIIIMSASQHNMQLVAKEAHADAFLSKPFDIDIFLSLIKKHLDMPQVHH